MTGRLTGRCTVRLYPVSYSPLGLEMMALPTALGVMLCLAVVTVAVRTHLVTSASRVVHAYAARLDFRCRWR